MSTPLTGKRILVTRPVAQQSAMIEALAALGAEAVSLPTLLIEGISPDQQEAESGTVADIRQTTKQHILDLDLYHHLIFISTNAVEHGVAWVEHYWPQWPVRQQYHAIGAATAKSLAASLSIPDIVTPDIANPDITIARPQHNSSPMNSEALLAQASLQQIDGQRVLIFRGVGGREHLANELRARGARVDYCEVYQRRCPEYPAGHIASLLADQPLSAIIANSTETLDNLLLLAEQDGVAEALLAVPLVLPGERVAAHARQRGFDCRYIADNATVAATTDCVRQHLS